jgi:NAD+ diphosphatase
MPFTIAKMKKKFVKEISEPIVKNKKSFWFVFQGDHLLVSAISKTEYAIPLAETVVESGIKPIKTRFFGRYGDDLCYAAEVAEGTPAPENMIFFKLRRLYGLLAMAMFHIAGVAWQIVKWEQTFQYCGRCGAKTENLQNEWAKSCRQCRLVYYPKIAPAVIVAVSKGKKILLARAKHYKEGFYSVLAGFVEPGENLEECVRREVMEEVNIKIKNLRYFGSQSWPFTDALMIGFTAEYQGGKVKVDRNELEEARWFGPEALPEFPDHLSIAWELIDWFKGNASSG